MGHTSYERDGDRTKPEPHDPLLGMLLNRQFRIVERLAAGGFGAIYRARHLDSKCDVAVKVLLPELASDPSLVARFRREGATLATLCSPNTVRTFEFGETGCPETGDGMLYIVMELLRGETLFERYHARGPMPWSRVTTIARAVCNSLGEAHALGIVHRDLKPANIFLMPHAGDDHVKVLDFGIAKILRSSADESGDLTQVGQMIGTSDYMSPEQILGGTLDGRSDIYTLGVLMYELVTGRRPFQEASNATGLLAALLTSTPPPPSLFARIPPFFEYIVMKCLAREAEDRFSDVRELAAALDHLSGTLVSSTHSVSQTDRVPPLPQSAPPARGRMARGSQHITPGQPEFSPAPVVPPARRGSQLTIPTYELTHVVRRDAVVRRVIWGLVLAVAAGFVIAAANLL